MLAQVRRMSRREYAVRYLREGRVYPNRYFGVNQAESIHRRRAIDSST